MNRFDFLTANLRNKANAENNNRLLEALLSAGNAPNALDPATIAIAQGLPAAQQPQINQQQKGVSALDPATLKIVTEQLRQQVPQSMADASKQDQTALAISNQQKPQDQRLTPVNGLEQLIQQQYNSLQQQPIQQRQEQQQELPREVQEVASQEMQEQGQDASQLQPLQYQQERQPAAQYSQQPLPEAPPAAARTLHENANSTAGQEPKSVRSKISDFFNSPFLQTIGDIGAGLAAGRDDSESLGLAGINAVNGARARRVENQTVDWLIKNGFRDDEARQIARSPAALNEVLRATNLIHGIGRQGNEYEIQSTKDGQVIRFNKNTGAFDIIAKSAPTDSIEIVPDSNGDKYIVNKRTAEAKRIDFGDGTNSPDLTSFNAVETNPDTGLPDVEQQKALLAAIPPKYRDVVQKVADGEVDIKTIAKLSNGERAYVTTLASKVNPFYDQNYFQQRKNALNSFVGNGVNARSASAANTAIGHLVQALDAYKKLNNSTSPLANLASQIKNDTIGSNEAGVRANLKVAIEGVSAELSKALKGTGAPNQTELDSWKELLSPNMAPEAFKQAVYGAIDLLAKRANQYRYEYESIIHKPAPRFLNDDSIVAMIGAGIPPEEIKKLEPRLRLNDQLATMLNNSNIPTEAILKLDPNFDMDAFLRKGR